MSIIFARDFSAQNRLKRLKHIQIKNEDGSLYSFSDFAVVNFESPIPGNGKAIPKIGPNIKNTTSSLYALKEIGVKLVTLANNHFRDYGEQGCMATIKEYKKAGINYVGGGLYNEAKKPFVLNEDGKQIAIINVCENEFSSSCVGGIGSNGFDLIELYDQIKTLKNNVDRIIIINHGGVEHFQLPTPKMKKKFHFLIDIGADVIINHHQHCFSGWEKYKEGLIFYGLGNFLFDSPWSNVPDSWFYGYMVKITFTNSTEFELVPYSQCKDNEIIQLLSPNSFDERISDINDIIQDETRLEIEFADFVLHNKFPLSPMLPYHKHYLRALYHRGILPVFMPKTNKLEILNWARCESLHECQIKYLEEILKKELA